MNEIQKQIVEFVYNDGLNDYLLHPKNTWLIITGGYEEQLTAFLYHAIGGATIPNLYTETMLSTNTGKRIIGDAKTISQRPDMTITGEVGETKNRLVLAKQRLSTYTNIPAIAFIQLGHDFANQVKCHIGKFESEIKRLKNSLKNTGTEAEGLLHIQIATEYIFLPECYLLYRSTRGLVNSRKNWKNEIDTNFKSSGMQCKNTKTYNIEQEDGLHLKIHCFFGYTDL